MRSPLRAFSILGAAALAAAAIYLLLTMPPAPVTLDGTLAPTYVTGAYHIHSARSDGTGTVDEIAAAAARAGLAFVVLTDHGDGTRAPDAPVYRHGVLCIDAVELSTSSGHLVALGLTAASPYPLAGSGRDVIEDIHRLGGRAVVAHPDSPNPDLRWRGSLEQADGIEWINADSEWRDDRPARLIATALRSIIRPEAAIASLFNRPGRSLMRWDSASRVRPLFGLAAVDAHARIGWEDRQEPRQRTALARPTYAQMFGTLGQTVALDRPLAHDAAADATVVLGALTGGRSFSIVRAYAGPAVLDFSASRGGESLPPGTMLEVSEMPLRFRVHVPQAPGVRLTLLHDGREIASARGRLEREVIAPGVYRAEAWWPNTAAPWLVSNPIVVGAEETSRSEDSTEAPEHLLALPLDRGWVIEREPSSTGSMTVNHGVMQFKFALGPGIARGQYVALTSNVDVARGVDRLRFTARADRSLRVSLQVRLPGTKDAQRWRRSVFIDGTERTVEVPLSEFEPADAPTSRQPLVAPVQDILFVVDTVNTPPGASGTIYLSNVSLGLKQP